MPYSLFEKATKFKLWSAAKYRWRFKAYSRLWCARFYLIFIDCYSYYLESLSHLRDTRLSFDFFYSISMSNGPDPVSHCTASDLGLLWLSVPLKELLYGRKKISVLW